MGFIKKSIIVIIVFVLILVPTFMYFSFLKSPASRENKNISIRIKSGMTSSIIIDKLYSNGLISNKLFAKIYMKTNDIGKNLKAGTYKFNLNMNPTKIFNMLKNREVDLNAVNFTIPEGFTIKQIAQKLFSTGLISNMQDFIDQTQHGEFNYEFLKDIPKDREARLEGYLFPDTYEFEKGMTINYMINEMLRRFNLVYSGLKPELYSSGISLDKAVIMASMIEEEAKIPEERSVISAVLYNRLKTNMLLQIDATVQYALGEHRSVLYYKDLKVNSKYNTYKYKGLPIGPISNPGEKSIEAALSPAKVNYIYYVSKGDGSHFFTKSYREFLNVKNALKRKK